jgi:hypothetical protein
MESKFNFFTFVDTYCAINIGDLKTVFLLSMSGYLLALADFVTEIMWHCCCLKGREPIRIFPCHVQTLIESELISQYEVSLRLYSGVCYRVVTK